MLADLTPFLLTLCSKGLTYASAKKGLNFISLPKTPHMNHILEGQ